MYFIKKINLDPNQNYKSCEIVDHTSKQIAAALLILENSARSFVKEECGREAGEQVKIIDINDFSQVHEPTLESMLLYRLSNDNHKIHVYQKKNKVTRVNGWITSSDYVVSEFYRVCIFELEEYNKLSISTVHANVSYQPIPEEMVVINSGIKIPKIMTVAPMCDLINELKNSDKFRARYRANNDSEAQYFNSCQVTVGIANPTFSNRPNRISEN
ncbi:peptidase C19 subfamily protein [Acanthamoeba polyphaga moumouvirus]|uniref:Peptidase C19 subfamily protein n=1 Tax=Acanthamoeba polyphaga moumouvirus TaxID=1269028 RepID=L7RDK0_9VIRU|nr:peptidase C19 subfamily protein [Acanthamoeba polyphaga moumouvirus]AGC02148.1 peptidase C19 subfamily protein [Acanthamoeba polyphaga moumouvirus]